VKISGVMPLRNAVKLWYPFELAIRSLRPICDEVVVLVDPTSEDDSLARVRALAGEFRDFTVIESVWNMDNHKGFGESEIAKQTSIVCEAAGGDWIFSLQADEVLHEAEAESTRAACTTADADGVSALSLSRLYFYGGLTTYRDNWTVPCLRLFRRGKWVPDRFSGGMQFVPVSDAERSRLITSRIFHYSRVGDPAIVARRVRNLDTFYHEPAKVKAEEDIAPYTFDQLRKLDTYVEEHVTEADDDAKLCPFPLEGHPRAAIAHFEATP